MKKVGRLPCAWIWPSSASWRPSPLSGSDLDAATQRQLTRGERLVQVLKQPQYKPLSHEKQVTILYAATRGYLDQFPSDVVAKYEAGPLSLRRERYPQIFSKLEEGPGYHRRDRRPAQDGLRGLRRGIQGYHQIVALG